MQGFNELDDGRASLSSARKEPRGTFGFQCGELVHSLDKGLIVCARVDQEGHDGEQSDCGEHGSRKYAGLSHSQRASERDPEVLHSACDHEHGHGQSFCLTSCVSRPSTTCEH